MSRIQDEVRLKEIEEELSKERRLILEKQEIEARIRAEDTPPVEYVWLFSGDVARTPGELPRGLTVVQKEDGKFVTLPHLMFEKGAGEDGVSPMTREEFKKAQREGRVYLGGHENVIDQETAQKLLDAGYRNVRKRAVAPRVVKNYY